MHPIYYAFTAIGSIIVILAVVLNIYFVFKRRKLYGDMFKMQEMQHRMMKKWKSFKCPEGKRMEFDRKRGFPVCIAD